MKAKLETIREDLSEIFNTIPLSLYTPKGLFTYTYENPLRKQAGGVLTLVDELLAELEGEGLLNKAAESIEDASKVFDDNYLLCSDPLSFDESKIFAKAAINVIKG